MLKRLYLFCFFLVTLITGDLFSATLSDRWENAKVGDYMVYSHQKHITLIRVFLKEDSLIAIEEITKQEDGKETSWPQWLENGAPGSNSWTLSNFDLKTGELQSIFSFTTNEWLTAEPLFTFLPTLLKLELIPLESDQRRKVGVLPRDDEVDKRPFWLPPISFNGKITHPQVDVFRTVWPSDGGELSGKFIDLYMSNGEDSITYLPYWLEIVGKLSKVKIRAIDSGNGSISPKIVPIP